MLFLKKVTKAYFLFRGFEFKNYVNSQPHEGKEYTINSSSNRGALSAINVPRLKHFASNCGTLFKNVNPPPPPPRLSITIVNNVIPLVST